MREIDPADEAAYVERMRILEMIEQGVISAAQGAALIRALEGEEAEKIERTREDPEPVPLLEPEPVAYASLTPAKPAPEPGKHALEPPHRATAHTTPAPPPTRFARWRNWWYYPLSFGILVTVLSGWLIYVGTQNTWASFWMACIWLPLWLGIFIIVLSWYSHQALWMHVRVQTGQDEWPRRIAVSLPLPLEFGAWVVRTFRSWIPGLPNLDDIPLDEIITAVRQGVKPESPIYIEVEEAGAEKVEVYIG